MLSTSIGRWDNDSSYPGREQVWVDEGLFFYHDSCPIAVPAMGGIPDSLEVMYGASTQDGYPIVQTVPGTQPSTRLLDLGDNFTLELGGPPPPPFFLGSILGPTDHLIYVDVP
jgi:hypothetical protein